jgi:hypothetical protein
MVVAEDTAGTAITHSVELVQAVAPVGVDPDVEQKIAAVDAVEVRLVEFELQVEAAGSVMNDLVG